MANQDAAFGFRAIGGMGSSYETQGTSSIKLLTIQRQRFFKATFASSGTIIVLRLMQMLLQLLLDIFR